MRKSASKVIKSNWYVSLLENFLIAFICRFVLNVETLIVKLYGNAWPVSPDRIAIMEKCVAIVSHNTDY